MLSAGPDRLSAGRDLEPSEGGVAAHAVVPLLEDYLSHVAARTSDRVGKNVGVAVTIGLGSAPMTVGASTELVLEVDLVQYAIGVGPCLHALRTGITLYVPDLGADDRWGEYGPEAASRGVRSCVSVPVMVDDQPQAAFKVYSDEVDGFDPDQRAVAERTAQDISGGVGLAMHLARQAAELDDRAAAMDRRRTIDLALGMLMERNRSGADEAFDLLRRYSQNYNVRLHQAASQVVRSHDRSASAATAPFVPAPR